MRHILVATPLKGGIPTAYYLAMIGLLQKSRSELQFQSVFLTGTSVNFARNEIAKMARDGKFTHVLWWDVDLKPTPEQFDRLIAHDEDIVCAMYPRRTVTTSWHITAVRGEPTREDGLQKVFKTAIGFSIMRVSVLEKIAATYPDHDCIRGEEYGKEAVHLHEFFPMGLLGPNSPVGRLESIKKYLAEGGDKIEVVRTLISKKHEGQTMLTGEDYYFCRLALGAGFSIHLDTKMIVKHTGETDFPIETEELTAAANEKWRQP